MPPDASLCQNKAANKVLVNGIGPVKKCIGPAFLKAGRQDEALVSG